MLFKAATALGCPKGWGMPVDSCNVIARTHLSLLFAIFCGLIKSRAPIGERCVLTWSLGRCNDGRRLSGVKLISHFSLGRKADGRDLQRSGADGWQQVLGLPAEAKGRFRNFVFSIEQNARSSVGAQGTALSSGRGSLCRQPTEKSRARGATGGAHAAANAG